MPKPKEIEIQRNKPRGEAHALAHQGILDRITERYGNRHGIVPLAEYLQRESTKPRSGLNPHQETFILKTGDEIKLSSLQELADIMSPLGAEVLGVASIGNNNQMIKAVVQGFNRDNPQSGYERPTVAEGPHMILAPYAVDKKGQLHLFRQVQMRTGEAVIDTARGFAKTLEGGPQMYDVENSSSEIRDSMKKIAGEESGQALKIKRVTYLGAPRVNSTFVTSKSAIFGVEVDYDEFLESQKFITEEELQRRNEQFEHEGLVGAAVDIPLPEYVNYKLDSNLSKDMAADFGTDTVVIDFLAKNLSKAKRILTREGEMRRRFKSENPVGYVQHMTTEAKYANPDKTDEIDKKATSYLSKLYRESLDSSK